MKTGLLLLLVVTSALAKHDFNESEEEFEKEFNVINEDKDLEKKLEEELKKAEEEINEQNKKFDEGEAKFERTLYPDSDLSQDELEKEKGGLIFDDDDRLMMEMGFASGLIFDDKEDKPDPENEKKLGELYDRYDRSDIPESYNSVELGHVTEVKNQGACGSCSAFASMSNIESTLLKQGETFKDLDLSEQMLIDCAFNNKTAFGCYGATITVYKQYVVENGGGAFHEDDYPYSDNQPKLTCPVGIPFNNTNKIYSYVYEYLCDEEKMKKMIMEYGSATAMLYVNGLYTYRSGVFDGCPELSKERKIWPNHAVSVVGWGTDVNGTDFWLVKNSWSNLWGEEGYFRIQRGTNECGIEMRCASTSTVKPPEPPSTLYCDVSNTWAGLTGIYAFRFYHRDVEAYKIAHMDCTNSLCKPYYKGIDHGCRYLCGKETCP